MTDQPRVLVVDDQSDIRELAVMVLQGAAYRVEGCASGDETLVRLADAAYETGASGYQHAGARWLGDLAYDPGR